MKVFLTGVAGFIGSHVARRLVAEGCQVHALIRPGSNTWRINDILSDLNLVPYDLFSAGELDECLKAIRPDLCIHLAWCAEPGKYLTSLENPRYLSSTLQLAARLAELGCKRFVGAGTCFEYDTSTGCLSESSATAPRSLYAASKLGCYLTLGQLGELTGMKIAWLRFFYLYGPYEDGRRLVSGVISSLLQGREARVTEGEQIRDFLHVEDVAAAVWAVTQSRLTGAVNVGSGNPVAVRDLVSRIGDIMGRQELIKLGALSYSDSEPMFICANNSRLRENTSWVPRYNLDEGLRHTVGWWRAYIKNHSA